VEKLGLNYPEKNLRGPGQDLGACAPWPQRRTATALGSADLQQWRRAMPCRIQFESAEALAHD